MKKLNKWFHLNTVRKKVFLLSKLTGGILILFYMFTSELPTSRNLSFVIWLLLLVAVVTGVDIMLGRFISKPLHEINHTARQMAKLDFTAHFKSQADTAITPFTRKYNTNYN